MHPGETPDTQRPPNGQDPFWGWAGEERNPELRYEKICSLGMGGMGEVWRVADRLLGRPVVMKVARVDLAGGWRERFAHEARIGARLQHPWILAVYDAGLLEDGRPYLTLREAIGRPFDQLIGALHRASSDGRFGTTPGGWTLRRLVGVLQQAAEAVGHAHGLGILHRDLKPDNLLVGPFGEVELIDWGLALCLDEHDGRGECVGTPGYAAPEQLRGAGLDTPTDVFSLGALLHQLLSGSAPQSDRTAGGWAPSPPSSMVPTELWKLAREAMEPDPDRRPADGHVFAARLMAWLDAAAREAEALRWVAEAAHEQAAAKLLRHEATVRGEAANAQLRQIAVWAPVAEKVTIWQEIDAAQGLAQQAADRAALAEHHLEVALTHDPQCAPAHAQLAAAWQHRHAEASARKDFGEMARCLAKVRQHAGPAEARWVGGRALWMLETDLGGAHLRLQAEVETERRRIPGGPPYDYQLDPHGRLEVELPAGSYRGQLRGPNGALLTIHLGLGRGATVHWGGVDGPLDWARAMRDRAAASFPNERLVPGSWVVVGGDAWAPASLPRRRIYVDSFVMEEHPITNAKYIAFLDALVRAGREAEALMWAPRGGAARVGDPAGHIYGRRSDGGFALVPDAQGDLWDPQWPVVLVDWHAAQAYAAFRAETEGFPWRLPSEVEWEKAARGGDERVYPWGDQVDPSFCCMRESHPGRPLLFPIGEPVLDRSPYDIHGLGGNVRDWCMEAWSTDGPPVDTKGRLQLSPATGPGPRVLRGGSWISNTIHVRSAHRHQADAAGPKESSGIRLVRSV